MFSVSLNISLSGLLNFMLAYFSERVVLIILELLEQGRSSIVSETETQHLSSMQLVQGILPRKKKELASSNMELDFPRKKFLKFKNFMVPSNSKSNVSADSILKPESRFSNFRNDGCSSHPGSNACNSFSKHKVVLQSGEAELSTLLRILEEENETMKQALLETVMERKELVNEICQLFKALCYSLHHEDEEVWTQIQHSSYESLIIKPSRGWRIQRYEQSVTSSTGKS